MRRALYGIGRAMDGNPLRWWERWRWRRRHMDRSERISLRLSIAMHVALVLALEPSQQGHPEDRAPEPQMAQGQQIDLQVLKTPFARQAGTIPDRRDRQRPRLNSSPY